MSNSYHVRFLNLKSSSSEKRSHHFSKDNWLNKMQIYRQNFKAATFSMALRTTRLLGFQGSTPCRAGHSKLSIWTNHWGALLTCLTSSKLFTHIHITLLTFLVAKCGSAGKSFVDAFARLGSWKLSSLLIASSVDWFFEESKFAEINLSELQSAIDSPRRINETRKNEIYNSSHISHGITYNSSQHTKNL